ncbi:MAG: O-methyltransferase [Paludibacteraceae bacterium]|nr:O-methyltransferase [Paludibacteraceae bacterium]
MEYELESYIENHIEPERPELERIWHDTNVMALNGRMVSGHIQGRILAMLSRMIAPMHILELGTFTGYSALCLAEGLVEGGSVDTIEIDDELEDWIHQNLSTSPLGSRINLHIGDALRLIPQMNQVYDLVFIDADKRQYAAYLDAVLPKVRPGGYIFADNTLWDGKVASAAPHADKQTQALQQFNDMIVRDDRLQVAILPLRDGLTIIRKRC